MNNLVSITPAADDAPEFVGIVEAVVNGLLLRHRPMAVTVVKIDNWFGSKWLGFSGKTLGLLGVWNKPGDNGQPELRVPPFVPSRVVNQRTFRAPDYLESTENRALHTNVSGGDALLRKVGAIAPEEMLFWYSGKSSQCNRGAVMAYVPVTDSYWAWYASWQDRDIWRLVDSFDIKREVLAELVELGMNVVR